MKNINLLINIIFIYEYYFKTYLYLICYIPKMKKLVY